MSKSLLTAGRTQMGHTHIRDMTVKTDGKKCYLELVQCEDPT